MDKYLVTSALPYANGKLHIGHVAGAYLPADIFVRFKKMMGDDVIYICGTDEHGAPISIKAESEGVTPREVVDRNHDSIVRSFDGLNFEFDNFSGTARPEHVKLSQEFFLNLYNRGFITKHTQQQHYCEHDKRFLADRYVEGICPYCGAEGARGDQCDACGKLIDAVNLIAPVCKICGSTPVIKETTHWYIDLPKFEPELREWLHSRRNWKDNVFRFILSWLDEGLIERSITRDINWGVPVPLPEAEGKVLYVWFDAPIGYISSTIEWAKNTGQPERWKDYWLDPETKLIHFLGKDNIPFHTIIWPSMLMEQDRNYVLPHDVPANEYLNLEGQKISTSRNWAIWVEDFLKYFEGDLLRYVLAVNAPESKDADFSWKDFQSRVNGELANILGNLANRVIKFAQKSFDGKITRPENLSEKANATIEEAMKMTGWIADSYDTYKVRKAVRTIMDIARLGNKFFDETEPWKSVKTDPALAMETLYVCAEILRIVSIAMTPVLPVKMAQLRAMFGFAPCKDWREIEQPEIFYVIDHVETLFPKIEDDRIEEQVQLLLANSKEEEEPEPTLEHKDEIEFDDFMKLEIRLVKILSAEKIKKANKLLKLRVKIQGEERDLVAGIAKSYPPEELVGKTVAMLLNLKPRKIMGHLSQGMVLAAEHDGKHSVMVPDKDFPDGCGIA